MPQQLGSILLYDVGSGYYDGLVASDESSGATIQLHLYSTFPRLNGLPVVGVQSYGTIETNSLGLCVADSLLHRWEVEVDIQAQEKNRHNHDTYNGHLSFRSH